MKAITVYVFESKLGNCSNGGITSRHDTIYLEHPRGPYEIDASNPPENFCKVVTRFINFNGGYEYNHIEPAAPVEHGRCGYMAGGCFAYSSDARFNEISRYPLQIHDRTE